MQRRHFDLNLNEALDLKSTPPLARGLAWTLALGIAGLLCWYGVEAKLAQDAAAAAKKAAKKHPVATAEK